MLPPAGTIKEKRKNKDIKQVGPAMPDPSTEYSFHGDTIKLKADDYAKLAATYPNLSLADELPQLDLELADQKKWWGTMNAKLNYRNKVRGPNPGDGFPDLQSPANRKTAGTPNQPTTKAATREAITRSVMDVHNVDW